LILSQFSFNPYFCTFILTLPATLPEKLIFSAMSAKKIMVGDITCGANELFVISGPCVIEEESIMLKTAEKLKEVSAKLNIPIIYKSSFLKDNRSSLKYYDGPGLDKGMKVLAKIKEQFGFTLLTDIHYPDQAAPVAEVCDILQIPAYLCMQSNLMVAAAKTGKVINIKHGQFLAPENMKHPVGKCEEAGNFNIILTERGYTMGYNDLIVDPRSFYHMGKIGYPVVFDITHSIRKYGIPSADAKGGAREFLPVLSRAGIAAGVDGVFIETHPEPEKALCDAASQLCVYDLEEFLKPIIELHNVEVKYRN
jgi:2-dehydro-3-deoxyphosphooctonate aldolase (KDO 8-P synthase)